MFSTKERWCVRRRPSLPTLLHEEAKTRQYWLALVTSTTIHRYWQLFVAAHFASTFNRWSWWWWCEEKGTTIEHLHGGLKMKCNSPLLSESSSVFIATTTPSIYLFTMFLVYRFIWLCADVPFVFLLTGLELVQCKLLLKTHRAEDEV